MPNQALESVTPPFTAFRFEVVLSLDDPPEGISNPLCSAAFAECDGLERTMEPKSYSQGGQNARQKHFPGPVSHGRLTLRRGMTANLQLWQWFDYAAEPGRNPRAQGVVRVFNADGTPAVEFALQDCLPVRMRGPSLNASDGQIAIEELQIVYEALEIRRPGQSGRGGAASRRGGAREGGSVSGGSGRGRA